MVDLRLYLLNILVSIIVYWKKARVSYFDEIIILLLVDIQKEFYHNTYLCIYYGERYIQGSPPSYKHLKY